MKRFPIACATVALLLTACGGGSTSSNPSVPTATPAGVTTQSVTGTLTIGTPGSTSATQSNGRSPRFVSASTLHAALFIDGATTASGSTTTCTASTGIGTGCTITWTAQLAVPAPHTFAVEADSGAAGTPANTVLSEGSGSYAVVAGTNALGALSLNGVAAGATFAVGTCAPTLCPGTIVLSAAGGNAIAYTGATVVPTVGNLPSSGNVFDNGSATFVSSAPAIGTITGTAQTTFSSLAAGTLTVSGVNTTGSYTYQVTCAAGATGTFGLVIGGGATASGAITVGELAGLVPALTYPGAIALRGTALSFTCTGGNITSTGGTLPVN